MLPSVTLALGANPGGTSKSAGFQFQFLKENQVVYSCPFAVVQFNCVTREGLAHRELSYQILTCNQGFHHFETG